MTTLRAAAKESEGRMLLRMIVLVSALAAFVFVGHAYPSNQDHASSEPQTSVPSRIRLSPDVVRAQLIQKVDPVYPPIAKATKVSGTVVLHVIIGKDGDVQQVDFVSGPEVFLPSAMDAVKKWRYKPTLVNGRPVEVESTVSVAYSLADSSQNSAQQARTDVAGQANDNGQVIEGATYTNHTAHFTLTVPPDWHVTDQLMKTTPGVVGTIAAPKGAVAIMIQRWDSAISPDAAEKGVEGEYSRGFPGYRRIDEAPIQIDGQDAVSLTFHYDAPPNGMANAGGDMYIVWIRSETGILQFTCEARDSLFDEMKSTFQQIVMSYHYSAAF